MSPFGSLTLPADQASESTRNSYAAHAGRKPGISDGDITTAPILSARRNGSSLASEVNASRRRNDWACRSTQARKCFDATGDSSCLILRALCLQAMVVERFEHLR